MSATSGKVALRRTTRRSARPARATAVRFPDATITDLVGYGTANYFAGSGPARPGAARTRPLLLRCRLPAVHRHRRQRAGRTSSAGRARRDAIRRVRRVTSLRRRRMSPRASHSDDARPTARRNVPVELEHHRQLQRAGESSPPIGSGSSAAAQPRAYSRRYRARPAVVHDQPRHGLRARARHATLTVKADHVTDQDTNDPPDDDGREQERDASRRRRRPARRTVVVNSQVVRRRREYRSADSPRSFVELLNRSAVGGRASAVHRCSTRRAAGATVAGRRR